MPYRRVAFLAVSTPLLLGAIAPPVRAARLITEYQLQTPSAPIGITSGADGNLWFTELGANKIGAIRPTTRNYSG